MKDWHNIRNIMKDKKFYVVYEAGYEYTDVQNVFNTKEEAIQLWEQLTKITWSENNYQKYIENKKRKYSYYAWEEQTIENLLKEEIYFFEPSELAKKRRDVVKYIDIEWLSDEDLERFVQISTKEKQRREEIKIKKAKEALLSAIQTFNEKVGSDYAIPTDLLIQERKDKK